jgi:hypothetical protein
MDYHNIFDLKALANAKSYFETAQAQMEEKQGHSGLFLCQLFLCQSLALLIFKGQSHRHARRIEILQPAVCRAA